MQLTLKEYTWTPSHQTLPTDFVVIKNLHDKYRINFSNNRTWPVENYNKRQQEIKNEWSAHRVIGGGRSCEKSLYELANYYEEIKINEYHTSKLLQWHFAKIFNCFTEVLRDYQQNYISEERFIEYITGYQSCIATNKNLHLKNFQHPQLSEVENTIEQYLSKKNQ